MYFLVVWEREREKYLLLLHIIMCTKVVTPLFSIHCVQIITYFDSLQIRATSCLKV